MKRFTLIAALLGTLLVAGDSSSQAAYVVRRPAARVARRVVAPYRPRYIGPRYYGPRPGYYRPGYYRGIGPAWYGPGFYGPGLGFGPGVAVGVF
ncbi:MAG TPA: hypothetical protein VJ783_09400 [Pirellulales bacterium]|nr:hypothetical protein [Pirellulales bacterium]